MDLKIYSAHTGRSMKVPYNVNSLPELKRWIARELAITEKYLVLMTPRGSQVKPQYWADEIFAFDRELLSRRSRQTASSPQFQLPTIPSPPDASGITPRSPLKTQLAHLNSRATWARSLASQSEEIKGRIEGLNSEIVVLQTAAKIALVNLGNVSRSLQRAFNDTEMLAEKKLQSKNDAIDRIPSALEALGLVKVHPVFGKQEQTMTDFFDKTELSDAMEMCRKTNEDVEQRIKELKATMEEFIHQGEGLKQEVLAWEPQVVQDSGQVREIGLIADKIERASSRSFQNHIREYIPNIWNAATSLIQNLEAAHQLRNNVSLQSQSYLQRLSSAQERMVSIGPKLAEADDMFNQSRQSYDLLLDIETLTEKYGEALLEGFRRGLWKIRRQKRLEKAQEEISILRAQEQRARTAWADVATDGHIAWVFVDGLSEDDGPISPLLDGESESPVTRKDIEKFIATISKTQLFESMAQNFKERLSILVTSVQTPAIDVGTSPLRLDASDAELPAFKTREGSEIYEQLLRDKTRAEERARNFESRVKNLEEMLHRQIRTPPKNFSPIPSTASTSTGPQLRNDGYDEQPLLGRSVVRASSPDFIVLQKRVEELEREKAGLAERVTEAEGVKADVMANLEEQAKLFQKEREDLNRKTNDLEREVERCEGEVNRFEELVPKMESEMETLKKGRQNLLREMNLLQTESGAKIKELEDAMAFAEEKVAQLENHAETAAAETERITDEWRKASMAAEDATVQLEKFRRLNDENMVEQGKVEHLEAEVQRVKQIIGDLEAEKAKHVDAVDSIKNEFSSLRERVAEIIGLEKRRWESESLLHAVGQKIAFKDQHLKESDANVVSLNIEMKTLAAQLSKSKALCSSRTLKARDLTQRLYTQHTRCRQLLETLGLQVKSSTGSPIIRYGSSDKSDYLEPDDLDLLYWMESGDSDEESDKYTRYLGRIVIDLDAFSQAIINRVRDAEKYAKKWQKEARAYRDKSKTATFEAENKIAFRQFKEGDLALFLPTNNGRPWAAFNVNAPHYFLRENEAHRLGSGRDWLLARISKVEERTVDVAAHRTDMEEHNPFDLADGLRWYFLDAIEEKPSTIVSRELARSMALQKSELRNSERKASGSRRRMSQSTPGLIPGREDGVAMGRSALQEEEEV